MSAGASTSTSTSTRKKVGKKRGINLYRLSKKLIDEDETVNYCQQVGLIARAVSCPTCKVRLDKIYLVKRAGRSRAERRFQCNRRKCRVKKNQVSIRKRTWFEKSHLSLRKSLLITYCFINKLPYRSTIHETSISSADSSSTSSAASSASESQVLSTSTETIADYFSYCREVCEWAVETKLGSNNPIGGVGKTVEIDESKFGKRKYHKGRFVEGQWVFGGICRETKEIFLVALPNNKRDRRTLEPIILAHILPGTTVISDCWKAYDHLGAVGFNHLTVNHSYNFVDPNTGAHTNNIENLWWQVKRQLSETHTRKSTINWTRHLCEYMWRHSQKEEELFEKFLEHASELYNPNM